MTTVLNNQLHESIKKQVTAEYQKQQKSLETNSIRYTPDKEETFFKQSLKFVVLTEFKTLLNNTNILNYVDELSLTSLLELNICESFWWIWLQKGGTYVDLSKENVIYLLNTYF